MLEGHGVWNVLACTIKAEAELFSLQAVTPKEPVTPILLYSLVIVTS
jgi:hypothetical protein